jgi:hypothetical protein
MDHEEAIQNLATERYLLSEMTPAERESFEEHYFECAICADDLRAGAQFLADAKEQWEREDARVVRPVVAVPATRPSLNWLSWLQPQFALAAMAVLAVTTGVGVFSNRLLHAELDEMSSPKIVATSTLKSATRGEPTLVTVPQGGSVVLQFDIEETPSSSVQFVVKSADDAVVLRIAGDQHLTGDRVTLSIPNFQLAPGRYALVASTTTGGNEREVARYPLEVKRP